MSLLQEIKEAGTRDELRAAWRRYEDLVPDSDIGDAAEKFGTIVEKMGAPVSLCDYCGEWEWREDCHYDEWSSDVYCDPCRENHGYTCSNCDYWSTSSDNLFRLNYDDDYYCQSCWDDRVSYCEECEEDYLSSDGGHDHRQCECAPNDMHFRILANGRGVLHEDERILVELPQGFISDEAIGEVRRIVWDQYEQPYRDDPDTYRDTYANICIAVNSLERAWQTKRGNFTRRLSKALYDSGIRLDDGVLSRIGSRVREHADATTKTYLEITRDLNQPAEAFYNEGSCWWGSESASLCALKSWGGFALRSYGTADGYRDCPTGRAWIQPLGPDLRPTLDTFGAAAYVAYNGYGELSGYTPARLLSYLTSRTYRKIEFSASYQYVNSGGYLIADQATCDSTESVTIVMSAPHARVAA